MPDRAAAGSDAASHLRAVTRYYRTPESRIGYALFLGGTKHFGYYEPGDRAWQFDAALRRMEDQLASRLDLPSGARVLDAGCGVGDVAVRLATAHGLKVTGIDILDFNLAKARRRAIANNATDRTRFRRMDYAQLDFPDDYFHGAYTMETLVHSDRIEQVLAGLFRVLRPGGRMVSFEYSRSPESETTADDERFMSEINRTAAMPAFQRLAHGVFEQMLLAAGFVDVRADDLTQRMLPMLKSFSVILWPQYAAARLLRRPTSTVNAMSAVEFYRRQECWRYRAYTCRKPG